MEFSVKLAALPEGLSFPERFGEKLQYDRVRGVLSYRGFMTKCSYDELSALSNDPEYHRALEQLFVLTSGEVAPAEGRMFSPTVMMAVVGAVLVAAVVVWGAARRVSATKAVGPTPAVTASNGT